MVEWLLDCEPRAVQLEALRRSYYGHALYDAHEENGGEPNMRVLRDGPVRGWGHFLEMRLGKTPTTLNEYALLNKHQGLPCLIVVSPNSYKVDWGREVEKFGLLTPTLVHDSRRNEGPGFLSATAKDREAIFVVNYESFITESAQHVIQELLRRGAMLVADESIKLKGHSSLRTQAILDAAKDAPYTRPLTGRPLTQGPSDLYCQLRFAKKIEGVVYHQFKNRFQIMGGFKNKQVKGIKNEDKLNALIGQSAFVAKRIDWSTDDWDPQFLIEETPLTPKQLEHYNEMESELLTSLDNGDIVTTTQMITARQKMQQISSGFIYDEDGGVHWLEKPDQTPKAKKLLQALDEQDQKTVVVFHYAATGEALLEMLKPFDPAILFSTRGMKKHGRDIVSEKKRFNESAKCRLILVQAEAAKYGHDLSGRQFDRTTLMAFFENTYSLDTRSQVERRITANNQDWQSFYLDFVSAPVERGVIEALVRKEGMEEAIFGSYGKRRWVDEQSLKVYDVKRYHEEDEEWPEDL